MAQYFISRCFLMIIVPCFYHQVFFFFLSELSTHTNKCENEKVMRVKITSVTQAEGLQINQATISDSS